MMHLGPTGHQRGWPVRPTPIHLNPFGPHGVHSASMMSGMGGAPHMMAMPHPPAIHPSTVPPIGPGIPPLMQQPPSTVPQPLKAPAPGVAGTGGAKGAGGKSAPVVVMINLQHHPISHHHGGGGF